MRRAALLALALSVALSQAAIAQTRTAGTLSATPVNCPASDPNVWVNTTSNIYWPQGSEYYGKTKHGGYACTSAAVAMGARAAKSGGFMKKSGGAMHGGATTGGAMTGGAMTGGAMTGGAMSGGAAAGTSADAMASPKPHHKKHHGSAMQGDATSGAAAGTATSADATTASPKPHHKRHHGSAMSGATPAPTPTP